VTTNSNPPDARVQEVSYTPEQIMAASAAMNAVLNRPLPPAGTLIYDPAEKRSLDPDGFQPVIQRSQVPQFASRLTKETVAQLKGDIQRAVDTSTGFAPYVLLSPARMIFPVETPFLNLAPRVVGPGTDVLHWKSILSMFYFNSTNSGPFGLSNLGGTSDGGTSLAGPSYNVLPFQSDFQTIAVYDSATFQSVWRSRALEGDLLARLKANLIYALKLAEENWLLNGATALWRPAAPLVTSATTGGHMADTDGPFWVQISAVLGSGQSAPSAMVGPIAMDTTTTGVLNITFSGVINAASYKVYIGAGATPPDNADMFIAASADYASGAAPTQPTDYIGSMSVSCQIITLPTSGANPRTDGGNATVPLNLFDGAVSLCYKNPNTGSNPSVGEQGMTSVIVQPASPSGLLAIKDLQYLFRKMYSQARANPSHLFVSPVESVTIDDLVGTSDNFRVITEPNSAGVGNVVAGVKVRKILNQVTGNEVELVTLPYLPQGVIMAGSYSIPFPAPDVKGPPFRIECNQDYTAIDYQPTQENPQTWAFGMFTDETLANEYQGGWGILEGIQPAAGV
jgi:hypothetical protein